VGAKPYSYDQRGRLIGVAEGLTVLSDYDYDDNGNRLSRTTPGGTDTGSYDDQDRLLSYGDFTFTYGENGELQTKTDTVTSDVTTYVYDARGSLRSVTLPDTTVIDYVIDGQGRRVGKKVDGALVQGFLYKDQLRIAAELDSAGEVVAQFSYVGGSHGPDWMTKGGALYRFVKDQVGSVRLVVNALTGEVAQELEYDEFGVVTSDSNPGFQPFGFAGGLYDGDTGLTRFGARDYDAGVGRWTAKDDLRWDGGDPNLFAYVASNPVSGVDPSGDFVPAVVPVVIGLGELLGLAAAVLGPLLTDYSCEGSKPKGYSCTTRCQANGGPAGAYYVEGTSSASCSAATAAAKASVPRGQYPRHCSCWDTEGFRGTGHQCE
jgi:RHS repeat-associated protein